MHLFRLQFFATAAVALAVRQSSELTQSSVTTDLNNAISAASRASVELRARWSEFGAPSPAVVVNVTTENDVVSVVCPLPRSSANDLTCLLRPGQILHQEQNPVRRSKWWQRLGDHVQPRKDGCAYQHGWLECHHFYQGQEASNSWWWGDHW
jgi:hypothetical protein